jgi:guanylate kinase
MYNIVALIGKAGSGKDTILQGILKNLEDNDKVHEIVSCTSRPMREGEKDGINYHYYSPSHFVDKIMCGQMLEYTSFNNWWYGTSTESVRQDGVINFGAFNPDGVRKLIDRDDCNVTVYWITASDKTRLLRQLNREENPNVKEIIRRFGADVKDFENINFDYTEISNETQEDLIEAIKTLVCQTETTLAQGRN